MLVAIEDIIQGISIWAFVGTKHQTNIPGMAPVTSAIADRFPLHPRTPHHGVPSEEYGV